MRAPPESLMPMMGTRLRSASSCTLTIFSAVTSPSEPPNTVAGDAPLFHAKTVRSMRREDIELHERSRVQEHLDAVARRGLSSRAPLVGGLGFRMQRLVAPLAVLVDLLFCDGGLCSM